VLLGPCRHEGLCIICLLCIHYLCRRRRRRRRMKVYSKEEEEEEEEGLFS